MSDFFNGWDEDGEPVKWREDHCYKVESKMNDLIERLRDYDPIEQQLRGLPIQQEAADALEAKDKRIAELEAYIQSAPRPVVDMSSDDVVLFLNDWMVWQDAATD